MKIFPTTSIKQLDADTIENEPIASIDLMERASRALARAIAERWDFCRTGEQRWRCACPGATAGREGLPARGVSLQYERDAFAGLRDEQGAAGRRAGCGLPRSDHPVCTSRADGRPVVIDGLFGSGLNKALSGGFAAVVKYINASPATVVSIDIPSGLMGEDNTYNVHTNIVRAHLTLSLQLPKLAFLFAENGRMWANGSYWTSDSARMSSMTWKRTSACWSMKMCLPC